MTGGTGFIGSHLVNELMSRDYELICQKRSGSKPRIKILKEPIWVHNSEKDRIAKELLNCNILIHTAATGVPPQNISLKKMIEYNIYLSYNFLISAFKSGVKNFFLIGSSYENQIAEQTINSEMSFYAITKYTLFLMFSSFAKENDIKLIYCKLPNIYGEGQYKNNLWPSLKYAAINDLDFVIKNKDITRDFLSVEKAKRAIVDLISFNNIDNGTISEFDIIGEKKTIFEFSSHFWKKWGAKGKIKLK